MCPRVHHGEGAAVEVEHNSVASLASRLIVHLPLSLHASGKSARALSYFERAAHGESPAAILLLIPLRQHPLQPSALDLKLDGRTDARLGLRLDVLDKMANLWSATPNGGQPRTTLRCCSAPHLYNLFRRRNVGIFLASNSTCSLNQADE